MTSSSAVEDEHLTDSDLSDDEERNVEQRQEEQRVETPRPVYSDEELHQLVEFIQRMCVLSCLDHRDWHENSMDTIRRWLLEVNEPLLTVSYDGSTLTACLGFPTTYITDMSYFRREPNEIFSVEAFHDEIQFGTVHSDVDGCLLHVLEWLYMPFFRNYPEWNDTVRQRFCSSMDRFLGFLTGMHYQIGGMAVLYVPYVIKQLGGGDEEGSAGVGKVDRQLVKSLEGIALYWTTQIRTLLGDCTLTVPHDLVTVRDEFEFWEYRYEVLQGINAQLAQSDVDKVFRVLRQSNSVHMPQVDDLIASAKMELVQSLSNIKYLHLLIEPCSKIDLSNSPAELTKLLPRIIHLVRYIWLNSEYYNTRELITGLFRNLSNQIIMFCTQQTKVQEILEGRPRFGIEICNMSIDCCLVYKGIYEEISSQHSQVGWQLDEGIIFNHVDAFVERLNDVIDICESMIVFGRLDENETIPRAEFGGSRGEELDTIAANVENTFLQTLKKLQRCSGSQSIILNVHREDWYDQVAMYRTNVQHLEETVQRLIFNVFQHVCNVEEALEGLQALLFYSYRHRGTLRKTFLREVSRLWRMFSQEMDATSRKLLECRQQQESWLSHHVSRALNYRINLERLTWLRNRLKNAEWLPTVKEAAATLAKFDSLRKEYERESHQAYEDWQTACCGWSADLNQRLERYLIIRSKQARGLLECNIDPAVVEICEQAQHFERLGFPIPSTIKKFYERCECLRSVYNSVTQLCLSYNRILMGLTDRERKLFRPLVLACDRHLAPGIFKFTYGADLSEQSFFEDCGEFIQDFQQIVHIYKRANRGVARCCEKICDTTLLRFNFMGAVDISVLQQQLSGWLASAGDTLRNYYNNILELLSAFSRQFHLVKDEMSAEWILYVNGLDDMLANALMTSARSSLTKLYEALHRDEDMAPAPILVLESDVKDGRIVFSPDMDEIATVLCGVIDNIRCMLDQFPRLGYKLRLPKAAQRQGFAGVFREDQECSELMRSIQAEISKQRQEMESYQEQWNHHRMLWETTEEQFTERLMKSARTAGVFEGGIEHYSALADDVSFVDAITNVYFILINQNALKSTILDWIEKWQALNIKMLLDHATNWMRGTYRYMRRNERNVMKVPRTIRETVAAKQLFERLIQELPLKQATFTPMLELFVLLHKYQVNLAEKTHEQVLGLESAWLHYLQTLSEADEMLDNEGDENKLELAKQAEKFKFILKEFLEDFYSKLPKK
ncbi:dynein-1-beta heavy chain, flagellar inner arm I1 complex [Drosophila pseudoobscura]|uniref:Dynein-1-beta heavy chain, flagellar inner arm I1 complex n=1 Tax=Drosophila pseudoobscura pseudoobscura TaxID=46245 RepID=A0A6I8V802_DROPS|nr:dynein-1-beta heavy chain, flagellar inner arm I1 complex [Drosophila pseudoobscura]XP_015035664.2 dynein-1-beta heavy chain, flagellar inner arm I1 complex [Drosophila pseudoobscura]XP_015035665.2 dynein-1-beta heavy chain, flagellar inner arm I1 complex [Drosophila pseudoobscura]